MKKIFFKITFLLFFVSFFLTCEEEKSNLALITSCSLTIDGTDYVVTFDVVTKKDTIILPIGSNIPTEATIKNLVISAGASSSVMQDAKITIIDGIATIIITAEDGTEATFTVEFVIAPSFQVTFNSKGGTAITTQTIAPGSKVNRPENPTREGNVFVDWFKDETFTTPFHFDNDVVTANITLYALWHVMISYNSKGGTAVQTQTINSESKTTKPANPTRNGYVFLRWCKDETLTTAFNFDNDVVTENITLYALWQLSMVIKSYSGDTFLGVAMRDTILKDADTILSITQAGTGLEFAWAFGGLTGTKITADGTFFITRAEVKKATLTDGAKFTFTLNADSKEAIYKANEIRYWKDLQAMRVNLTGSYSLMKDISFPTAGTEGFATAGFNPIGNTINKFTGKFNGNYHTISNFKIDKKTNDYVGLFGSVEGATIEKVVIDHAGIKGGYYVGVLVGQASRSIIQNVGMKSTNGSTVLGAISVGGLVGAIDNSSKVIGYATGAVSSSEDYVGGLVGDAINSSTVIGYATGMVNSNGNLNVGGLVGRLGISSTVIGYTTGRTVSSNGLGVGGLVGTIENSSKAIGYTTGYVSGNNKVGGLVGRLVVSTDTAKGYARDTVARSAGSTNTNFGLLVGDTVKGSIATGYYSETESTFSAGASAGSTSVKGSPITTSTANQEMFARFTFGNVVGQWTWVENGKWPAINLGFEPEFSKIAPGDAFDEQPIGPKP